MFHEGRPHDIVRLTVAFPLLTLNHSPESIPSKTLRTDSEWLRLKRPTRRKVWCSFYALPFFLLIPSIKDSLVPLDGLRTHLQPLHPVGRVQRRESSRPDHNAPLQVWPMFVSQPGQSEKLSPRDPLHNPPHDLKHLVYPQLLRDPQPLQLNRSLKTLFLLSRLLFNLRNHPYSRPLQSIQTLASSLRKPLRLCDLSLPDLNNPCCPQHLLVYLLPRVYWHPPAFPLQLGGRQPTLLSHKLLTRCHHKRRL